MDHERDILEQQLWELLYDLLPEEEALSLRGRIGADPDVGALYERIVRQKGEVAEAVKWPCEDFLVSVPPPAAGLSLNGKPSPQVGLPRAHMRYRGGRSYARYVASVIAALGAAVLLGWIGYASLAPGSLLSPDKLADAQARLMAQNRRVVIAGPSRLVEGAPQSFSVTLGDVTGEPVSSQFAYAFYSDRSERPIAEGSAKTDADGRAIVDPPRSWDSSSGRLEVRAQEDGEPLVAWFAVTPTQYTAQVALDKTAYAPGETVRFRGRALSPFGAEPAESLPVQLELHDAEGNPVPGAVQDGEVDQGIVEGAFTLPSKLSAGDYSLAIASPSGRVESEREELLVQNAAPPVLATRGLETLERNFQVRMKSDAPLAAAPAPSADKRFSQANGEAVQQFFFEPEAANESFGASGSFSAALGEAARDGVAAGAAGDLALLAKKNAAAEPAEVAELAVDSFQRAAPDTGISMSLGADELDEGTSLSVKIMSQKSTAPLAIGAMCGGALIAQREIVLPEAKRDTPVEEIVELPLPEGATGPLYIGLYDYSQSPPELVDGKAAFCKPQRQLRIEANPLLGESADVAEQLEVTTTDENGAPVQALLCVSGQILPGDESQLGLRLAERARRGADQAEAAAGEALREFSDNGVLRRSLGGAAPSAPDDIQRLHAMFAWNGFEAVRPEGWKYAAEEARSLHLSVNTLGRVAPTEPIEAPVVVDNLREVQSRLNAELRNLQQRKNREGARVARVSVIGGAVLVGLLLGAALLRTSVPTPVWTVTLATALVALGVGVSRPRAATPAWAAPLVTGFPADTAEPGMLAGRRGGAPSTAVGGLPVAAYFPLPSQEAAILRESATTSPQMAAGVSKIDQLDVWLPCLSTDEAGRATIALPRPSHPTTVYLLLEGHGKERTGFAELQMQLLPRE